MNGRGLVALLLCTWFARSVPVFGQSLPNLKPHQLSGWPDTLVVHTNLGQLKDAPIVRDDQNIYVDWAVFNAGLGAATNRFDVVVLVDNAPRRTWFSSGLLPQLWTWVNDGNIGKLNPGFHTIRLEIDPPGAVEESDETDNFVEQQVIVTSTNIIPVRLFDAGTTAEGLFAFSYLGSIGRRYRVEYSTGVTDWIPMDPVTNLTGVVSSLHPLAPNEQRSYRVRLLLP